MAEINVNALSESQKLMKNKFLVFSLGKDDYCFKLYHVKEILGLMPHTPVPNTPRYIKGVINVRGLVIPVMDVRLRFGMEETQYNDRTCTIIVEHEKGEVGLIVDVVSEVLNIHDGEIMASNNGKVIGNEFLKGIVKVDETIKYVISFNNLIDSD